MTEKSLGNAESHTPKPNPGRAIHEDAEAYWNAQVPPPEVLKADPATCRHAVMDECVGARWGFEDCIACGKRFPMRDDCEPAPEPSEPDYA